MAWPKIQFAVVEGWSSEQTLEAVKTALKFFMRSGLGEKLNRINIGFDSPHEGHQKIFEIILNPLVDGGNEIKFTVWFAEDSWGFSDVPDIKSKIAVNQPAKGAEAGVLLERTEYVIKTEAKKAINSASEAEKESEKSRKNAKRLEELAAQLVS